MSSDRKSDETSVDLGDDLLLNTRTVTKPVGEPPTRVEIRAPAEESSDELFINARILWGEGLIEEAKQTLRRILIRDPSFVAARQRLAEIQELEIQKLLKSDDESETESGRKRAKKRRAAEGLIPLSEDAIANLEAAVGDESPTPSDEGGVSETKVEMETLHCDSRDHLDLGIAFLEMGRFSAAVARFQAARADQSPWTVAASVLEAQALLGLDRAFDALMLLEPLAADASRPSHERQELLYWIGRAAEVLARPHQALAAYLELHKLDSHYRDAPERLKRCAESQS